MERKGDQMANSKRASILVKRDITVSGYSWQILRLEAHFTRNLGWEIGL